METLERRYVLDTGLVALANDAVEVHQNSPATNLSVLANDQFDPAYTGPRQITSLSYGSEGGRVSVAADGQSVRYAPPADFFGTETFVYVVDHEFSATVTIGVQPLLAFDQYEIPPDGIQRVLDVLANDPFWEGYGGERVITATSVGSAGGEVEISGDGKQILYTPSTEAFGQESFIYIVDNLYPARVTIKIPQPLESDQLEMVQHSTLTFSPLVNDPFWPGYTGAKRITQVLDVNEGAAATISIDGRSITYAPAPQSTWDSFRYVVDSAYEAAVQLAIHRPVNDDYVSVDTNSTGFSIDVLANDYYYDLKQVRRDVINRVTSVSNSEQGGSVSVSFDGQRVLYTAPAGFAGSDSFTYLADGVHEARVTVQVERPVRDDYFYQHVFEDSPHALLPVLANDFQGNGYTGARQITSVSATEQGGTLQLGSDGVTLRYTPVPGYVGQDRFRYTVDGDLEAQVTLWVQNLAQNDYHSVCADPTHGPYLLPVLANDHFGRGYPGPGVITDVSQPTGGGSVSIVGGQTLSYSPGSTGSDSFTYTVDGKYEASVGFYVQNRLLRDQEVVDQNSDSQSFDVLANDFYYQSHCGTYSGPRSITAVSTSAAGGVVTVAADGKTVQYEPPVDFHGSDSFTYTVDNLMQSTVEVQVIRRVRDDQYRVAGNAVDEELRVLVNDLFGADYQQGQRITDVTTASAGGRVEIGSDGRSLRYTPAANFQGSETFVYTVDGRLKAEVEVVVETSPSEHYPVFDSLEDYQQFLIDDALQRYEHLFGQVGWGGCPFCEFDGIDTSLGTPAAPRDHSETNVQVEGVDEADIVEFDSDYIYTLTDGELLIVDAWPAEEMSVVSRTGFEGRAIAEFLHGDRLTVISETGGGFLPLPIDTGGPGLPFDARGDALPFYPYEPIPFGTVVTVLDVSDRAAPTVVQTTTLEGRYIDSRAIGPYVYALIRNDQAIAAGPRLIPPDPADDPDSPTGILGTYETREAYLERVTANPGELVDEALPNYSAFGPAGELVRTGLLNDPATILQPLVENATSLISVVSFNVEGDEPGLVDTSGVYGSGASTVYASLENFYVFDTDYDLEQGATTRLIKFHWDDQTGSVDFAGTSTVPGTILNQFSADEQGPFLRIATTISNQRSGNWTSRAENTLWVVQEDGGVFEFVGALQNLALDETMRSIRFLGDRALVTTFQTIDPLFGLDLSDPANPQTLGRLTLPGFSSYMQPIGENFLITVGQNTPGGTRGPTQVALFDISDLTQPLRLDEYTFARFSTSEAELDHHAFGYYAAHGILAIPTRGGYVERIDTDGDGYRETRQWVDENHLALLSVDVRSTSTAAVDLAAEIPHNAPVRRSGYIGDRIYSVANDTLKAVDVADPGTVIGEVVLSTDPNHDLGPPVLTGPQDPLRFHAGIPDGPLATAADTARAQLAANLQIAAGSALLVTAEPGRTADPNALQLVFQVGQSRYLVAADATNAFVLDSQFAFPNAGTEASVWHAIAQTPGPLAADFDGNQSVDHADLARWESSLGVDAAADANRNGRTDGHDFLAWQRGLGLAASTTPSGDLDQDGDWDGSDLLAWQRGLAGLPGSKPESAQATLSAWEEAFGEGSNSTSTSPSQQHSPVGRATRELDYRPPARRDALRADAVDAAIAAGVADPFGGLWTS
jgi:hypothetical protein